MRSDSLLSARAPPRRAGLAALALVAFALVAHDPANALAHGLAVTRPAGVTPPNTDGAWHAVLPPLDYTGTLLADPVGNRLLLVGGIGCSDVFEFPLATGVRLWHAIPASGAPTVRTSIAAVLDSVGNRIIATANASDTLYALSLVDRQAWSVLATTGSAPPSIDALAMDPTHERLIAVSGTSVYLLDLTGTPAWSGLTLTGGAPALGAISALYDQPRDRLLVYDTGGAGATIARLWTLPLASPTSWCLVSTAGTPLTTGDKPARTAYDPVADRLLITTTPGPLYPNSYTLHAITLAGTPTWEHISNPSTDLSTPMAGVVAVAGSPPQLLVYGQTWRNNGEVAAFTLFGPPAWNLVDTLSVIPKWGSVGVIDPVRHRYIASRDTLSGAPPQLGTLDMTNGRWTYPTTANGGPPYVGMGGAYDPVRDRLLFFGGSPGVWSQATSETWTLSLSGPTPLTWARLSPTGPLPPQRIGASMCYEQGRDRLVVFGGLDNGAPTSPVTDAWALSLSGTPAWTSLAVTNSEPSGARVGSMLAYDVRRDCLLVFGGSNQTDAWALPLDGTSWQLLQPGGVPPTVSNTAYYDALRDRIVSVALTSTSPEADALSLGDSPAWTVLSTQGGMISNGSKPLQGWVAAVGGMYDGNTDRLWLVPYYSTGSAYASFGARALDFGQPAVPVASCTAPFSWFSGHLNLAAYALSNPAPFDQVLAYRLDTDRNWPGFPITDALLIGAHSTYNFTLQLPVPDTAAVGANTLTMTVVGATAQAAGQCSSHAHDTTTAALGSLVGTEAGPGQVRLTWFVAQAPGTSVSIERSDDGVAFATVGAASVDGEGYVRYTDTDVAAGARYAWRLHTAAGVGPVNWVSVPAAVAFALGRVAPNPVRGAFGVRFCAAAPGTAEVTLLDVAGRVVLHRALAIDRAGWRTAPLADAGALPRGVYLVRVAMGRAVATTRAVVVR